MSWSTPPERSQFSLLFLVLSILLIFSLSEARAGSASCEFIDHETNEIVAEKQMKEGKAWKVPTQKVGSYLPKNTTLHVSYQGKSFSLKHNLQAKTVEVVKRGLQTRFHLNKQGYLLECVSSPLNSIVETSLEQEGGRS